MTELGLEPKSKSLTTRPDSPCCINETVQLHARFLGIIQGFRKLMLCARDWAGAVIKLVKVQGRVAMCVMEASVVEKDEMPDNLFISLSALSLEPKS